jgi:hypothetical protein
MQNHTSVYFISAGNQTLVLDFENKVHFYDESFTKDTRVIDLEAEFAPALKCLKIFKLDSHLLSLCISFNNLYLYGLNLEDRGKRT